MQHAELAALLVEAGNAEQEALLRNNSALADVRVAYILKDICLDGWSSNPPQALRAAAALQSLSQINPDLEIIALCAWSAGLEALIQGRMEQAIKTLEESHRRFLALAKPHTAAATDVSKLIALALLGRYEEAVACGLRARELFLAHGDVLAAGKIEHNIGNLYFRRDQYREAEIFHNAARKRFIAVNDQKQLATINNCLANSRALLHQFVSAETLYEEAFGQAEALGLTVTQAEIEGNIGNFALMQGRYDRALDYLERSRRRYASLGMPHQSATAEQEIADAYLELNLVTAASEIYARVIPKFAELGMRAEQARALAQHGRALDILERTPQAQLVLEEARALYAAEGNEVGEASVILSQAQLRFAQGDFAAAATLASAAEPALQSSGSLRRVLLTRWLRGEAERAQGHSDEARRLFEETLAEAESEVQPQVAERCHTSLGLLAAATRDAATAEKHFRSAIALIEELRTPLPGEEFRTAFFSNKLMPYKELIRLCLTVDDTRVAEALGVAESARSRALADTLGGNRMLLTEASDEFEADLMRQVEVLREELNYLYNQMDRPLQRKTPRTQSELLELQAALRERESKMLEIGRQLQHRGTQVSGPGHSLDLVALQKQLGAETALVEYLTIDDELLAFVVTNESVEVLRNLAGEAEIAGEVQQFRFQIDTLRYGSAGIRKHLTALTERSRKHLASLYDRLLRAIEPRLGTRRLVVVPHRALHYLPFQALHDGTNYLIERREVSYAPSATVLQQCLTFSPRSYQSALLMGVADSQIPLVREEIKSISRVFPRSVSLLDEQATAAALRAHLPGTDVLHLACHAQFRADNPVFSSLRLGDGWLTVRDAYKLKLECGLVTLSGCETGVNAIAPGDELLGLARGFFSAGSPSIVLSLWTVDDEATAGLMTYFYKELQRTSSPAAALRAAQRSIIGEQPHPFFWSPFVLVGRW